MHSRFGPIRALVLVVSATLVVTMGGAGAAFAAPDYPTWEEVEQARSNVDATREKIAEVEGYLSTLEAEAADSGRLALIAGENYGIAHDALDAATAESTALAHQAAAASARAAESTRTAGMLVMQLSRTGGGDLTVGLMLAGSDSDDLLYRLGAMTTLTEQAQTVYQEALADRNTAASLGTQAAVAEAARAELATVAQQNLDAAQAAAAQAEAVLADQRASSDQLYEQLALLKGTTADVERQYLAGVTAGSAPTPAAPAPAPAVVTPPSSGAPAAPTPVVPTPVVPAPVAPAPVAPAPVVPVPAPVAPPTTTTPPNAGAVATAIAFATSQLGDMYQLSGYGPDLWDCSGLTKASYASAGVYIGTHSSTNQYATMAAAGRLVSLSGRAAGDLLFYSTGGSTTASKYHVAMYIGGGQMIEAPYPGKPVRIVAMRFGDLVPYVGRPTP